MSVPDKPSDTLPPARRDFLKIATGVTVLGGIGAAGYAGCSTLLPRPHAQENRYLRVDVSDLAPGHIKRFIYMNRVYGVLRRTPGQITRVRSTDPALLNRFESDEARLRGDENGILNPSYFVYQQPAYQFSQFMPAKDPDEPDIIWWDPYNTARYDASGRVLGRDTWAKNLEIPDYTWLSPTVFQMNPPDPADLLP